MIELIILNTESESWRPDNWRQVKQATDSTLLQVLLILALTAIIYLDYINVSITYHISKFVWSGIYLAVEAGLGNYKASQINSHNSALY